MRYIVILPMFLLLLSCSGGKDADAIRKEISDTRDHISELTRKIAELESQLGEMDAEPEAEDGTLVKTQRLETQPFDHHFKVNGSVEAVNEAFISSEINGQIKQIHVREGQAVGRGQLLVSLNSDVIKSGLGEARSALALATTIYERREGLWNKKIGSEVQFLEARTNKEALENKVKALEAQLGMAEIKAPLDGIVDAIDKKEGEMAVPGFLLVRLVSLDRMYINADVSESYLSKISRGDQVKLTFPSYPDLEIDTVLDRTGNVIHSENRTFEVQVVIDNLNNQLKPNMMAILQLCDFSSKNALLIPSIILKNDMEGTYLYVVEAENQRKKANKVYVEPGMSEGSRTMIIKGLSAGQEVVVEGYNLVKDGMPVRIDK